MPEETTNAIIQFVQSSPSWDKPFTGCGDETHRLTYYRWLDGTEEIATQDGYTIATKRGGTVFVFSPLAPATPQAQGLRAMASAVMRLTA